MSASGEAWIESRQKRVLENTLIGPLAPAVGGIVLANRVRQTTYGVDRSLFPGNIFTMKKLGDPELDTFMLRWFRRAMIDELPQLADVFKGSMTLVGPRADTPEHIYALFDAVEDPDLRDEWKEVRFRQKPGIISSYAVHSHRNNLGGLPESARFTATESLAENARTRAELDIADFHAASLRHDLGLAVSTATMAALNYGHYLGHLLRPSSHSPAGASPDGLE